MALQVLNSKARCRRNPERAFFVSGAPMAPPVFSEACASGFPIAATTQRGADTAQRLREHAASIRADVVRFPDRRKDVPCMHPSPTANLADAGAC
ncbi:hypothetical protein E6A55_33685 (plasmid) [Cupriavidus necator H16]|uniref:Uncharacterized protein n=1 Tax=Cupriavidus necator (strain ATCC 17699 / DSM 428 / KCTC 22496 / NCIMB 10442 / H16 / Stanier 337) TaxID=381666 RepID=A0AAE6DKB6_CUPNH|nr:hypothetical protein E6A55_33685 [Cupriavidus necator H16]